MREVIKQIPVVPLRGMTLLPSMIVHFDVSRDKARKAVEHAMANGQRLFAVTQKDPDVTDPGEENLFRVGTVVVLRQLIRMPRDLLRVMGEGKQRAQLTRLDDTGEYLSGEVVCVCEDEEDRLGYGDEVGALAMRRHVKELFQAYCAAGGKTDGELIRQVTAIEDLETLVDQIAVRLPFPYEEKQRLLEALTLAERYERLCVILTNETRITQIRSELQEKTKKQIDANQREYVLREQLQVIRKELGDDTTQTDADRYRERLDELTASDEIKQKIAREIERFSGTLNTSESAVIRGYIETLLEMPWDKMSEDSTDLKKAAKQLDDDHYGLEKVKERVLEVLAVRLLCQRSENGGGQGDHTILCLVGPPGTGKTSIARSVAEALGRRYVRICLGGVRDEAEIRGHRRTYVGAMPGRIADGLRIAGVKNPLILLDEIDKAGNDARGDTASALLEVLDGEQNRYFRDHYIELPIDLSEVLFLATANDAQKIPRELADRMEIIELSGYTENEKLHIAREHLLEKQIRKNGLAPYGVTMTDRAIRKIITGYTREAGVRALERRIGEICRKAAREILDGEEKSIRITESRVAHYLGREPYSEKERNRRDETGVVCGLAWTSVGGTILQIEVNCMPGKGEFLLTGQLGDVMKESAQAGISYIRSVGEQWKIKEDFFSSHDIHIHIPEGAVPKDGPSAGITMATAMMSAITGRPVRADVAMTGEITLRGRVLPIGGLKEKLLAAKSAGIDTVLIPEKNRADVKEISSEIRKDLNIRYVENMEQVFAAAFV